MNNFGESNYQAHHTEPSRSSAILVLGILSLTCMGPLTGIPAWIMGRTDLKKIDRNLISSSFRAETKLGLLFGMLGTLLGALVVFWISFSIIIGTLHQRVVSANRDAVIADLRIIATNAQEYYERPASLGGGEGSFMKYSIPDRLRANSDGTYAAAVYDQEVVITGKGVEKALDGIYIIHEVLVSPSSIVVRKLN